MSIEIIGSFDKNTLYCTGSFTKLLTTFVSLSLLAERYDLSEILGDENFLSKLCNTPSSRNFLNIFQKKIGSKFSLHDVCTYYTGLPYTFDLSDKELESVDRGNPFKHHCILDEKTFLSRCENEITPVHRNKCKFHYSEVSIIFLGYLLEQVYTIKIEDLYQKYILDKYLLKNSLFSRTRPADVFCQDLSPEYDYPSVAILDHGYFCYSNGFYTTLNDTKILLENIFTQPLFKYMVDLQNARAASNRLMNGLTIELRVVGDDLIYGYEGLSFSGCNIWAYSTKYNQGYLTFNNSEEEAYNIIYAKLNYTNFDKVPAHTEEIYKYFIKTYNEKIEDKSIPIEYQGSYQRVKINATHLETIFLMANNSMVIRNPNAIEYALVYSNNNYWVKSRDGTHGARVGLYTSKRGNKYFFYDGTLYKKVML